MASRRPDPGRAQRAALLEGIELLPPRNVEYRGVMLREFDLDAALARRPALLLLDELAHSNVTGSRHAKRWQDARELLEAGIDVWSTLNVQPCWSGCDTQRAARNFLRKGNLIALTVDLAARRVLLADQELRLTRTEYRLLALLARNTGKVITHRQLLKEDWGPNAVEQTHYLRVFMGQDRSRSRATAVPSDGNRCRLPAGGRMKHVLISLLMASSLSTLLAAELPKEVEDQPPARPARDDAFARTPGRRVAFGSYESIQVNVDLLGNNIVGDAANEPSIGVNPLNRANMVVGWRQFDTVSSNFRQAGVAYTFDAGQSWTFPAVLTPGVFRSDPVVDADASGAFFYQSLKGDLRLDVFRSTDGGVSWSGPVPSFGGDKNWMAIDRTGGSGHGFIHGIWQRFGGACCGTNVFTRSIDSGTSYQTPVPVALWPTFGTLTVGPSGEVYATGIDGSVGQDVTRYVVAKSTNAGNPLATPTFSGGLVNIGGIMAVGTGPNPAGLLGQPNVFVHPGPGPRTGEVYVLGSVAPGSTDPMDVHFIRSSNGGTNWSAPVRVNDDAGDHWQWMAAASVAGNGRIDAIWYDTRGSGLANVAQLFYAYSPDGGLSWFENVAVTPSFDTSLGYPAQAKMGDYIQVVSSETGADAVYTATFNGEQDVYYVRLFPDCDGNGISDVTDVAGGRLDCNENHVPDECEVAPTCVGAGEAMTLSVLEASGGNLLLQWSASCQVDDNDYAVYEGTLGSYTSHAPRFCSTGGSKLKLLTPAAGSTYYLVVPTQAGREGSYGKRSGGVERDPPPGACLPQLASACTP